MPFNYQITFYRKNEFADLKNYRAIYEPATDILLTGTNFVYVVKAFNQQTYDWLLPRGQAVVDSFNTQERFVERQIKVVENYHEERGTISAPGEIIPWARLQKGTPVQNILNPNLFESWPLPDGAQEQLPEETQFYEVD
jgi:hypothetical protein